MNQTEFFVIVLDLNPKFFSRSDISLVEILELISTCIRGFHLINPKTAVAVIAAYPTKTEYVLRCVDLSTSLEPLLNGMRKSIIANVQALASEDGLVGSTLLSQALCRGVCFIKTRGKIAVFETSNKFSDFSKQHVQISNCGWALEDRIVLDLVSLNGGSEISSSLANLSIKSRGVQLNLSMTGPPGRSSAGRMQAVLFHIVNKAQGILKTSDTKGNIHMGAVCICHGNPLNCGYVCSVCLAIFCAETSPICAVCGSRFRRELRDASTPLNQRSFSHLVD